MRYYFMTSYASAYDRVTVAQFHGDLERELRIRAGAVVAGHLGSVVAGRPGTGSAELAAASAPAMVALCTDHYFRDRACGRDWAVFAERERDHRVWSGRATSCLIPLVWQPLTAPLPPAVDDMSSPPSSSLPSLPSALASALADRGLRDLLRTRGEEYSHVIGTTAETVLDAYKEQLRPMSMADVEQIEPAFGSDPADEHDEFSGLAGSSGKKPAAVRGRPLDMSSRHATVAISYVGADQAWADWIAALLTREGHQVNKVLLRHGQAEAPDELIRKIRSGVDRVVAVLSKNYFALLPGEPVDWERALSDGAGEDEGKMIRVRVDLAPLPAPVRGMRNVDFSDPRSDRAARLLEAVTTSV